MDISTDDAKSAAKSLCSRLAAEGVHISHSLALEATAAQLGLRDWNTASAVLDGPRLGPAVPVLRIQDDQLARDFYVRWLGFEVEWEHRFDPGLPLYCRVRRDAAVLDLSEHYGDGTPGGVLWIPVKDVYALRDELRKRGHPGARPGVERSAPGGPTMTITDPCGNVLRFCQRTD